VVWGARRSQPRDGACEAAGAGGAGSRAHACPCPTSRRRGRRSCRRGGSRSRTSPARTWRRRAGSAWRRGEKGSGSCRGAGRLRRGGPRRRPAPSLLPFVQGASERPIEARPPETALFVEKQQRASLARSCQRLLARPIRQSQSPRLRQARRAPPRGVLRFRRMHVGHLSSHECATARRRPGCKTPSR
jgi:hypothetical protein